MLSAQCVRKNTVKCDKKESQTILKDRYDKEFTSVCVCNPWKTGTTEQNPYCYNIIYNCEPLSLLNSREEVRRISPESLRLCFTFEEREKVRQILSDAVSVFCRGGQPERRENSYTKGHLKRGVE